MWSKKEEKKYCLELRSANERKFEDIRHSMRIVLLFSFYIPCQLLNPGHVYNHCTKNKMKERKRRERENKLYLIFNWSNVFVKLMTAFSSSFHQYKFKDFTFVTIIVLIVASKYYVSNWLIRTLVLFLSFSKHLDLFSSFSLGRIVKPNMMN